MEKATHANLLMNVGDGAVETEDVVIRVPGATSVGAVPNVFSCLRANAILCEVEWVSVLLI